MAQQRKTKGRRTGSILLDSLFYDPRIAKLSRPAFQLLIEFNQQYSGFNNGNLSATPKTLRFDWNDKTLKRVKRELLQAKLIEVTKRGVGRRPTLYALCHLPIDETSKHGIKAETTCSRRATGKRAHYYPVRRDIASEIAKTIQHIKK